MATTTYTPIYTTTLTSNESTVSFSSFGGYTDLRIVANIKLTGTNGLYFKPNSDSSSVYSATTLYGNGSSATSSRLTTGDLGGTGMYIPGGTFSTSTFSVLQIDFMNYTNTNVYKTALVRYSTSDARVGTSVELFAKTDAITSLVFGCDGGGSIAAGSTFTLYGIANAAIGAPKATGGIITYDDTYFYHTFGASGTFTPQQSLTADYLIVAGGGGGGNNSAGGGGAGGFYSSVSPTGGGGTAGSPATLSATGYSIVVGSGGAGGTNGDTRGSVGGNSTFNGITVYGGGGGGSGGVNTNGINGGSGGGAGYLGSVGTGTANQGYAGGIYFTDGSTYSNGGGGGGAGAVGQAASSPKGGDGGIGLYNAITNARQIGELSNGNYYLAGGGGGGGHGASGHQGAGAGGIGGGGAGALGTGGLGTAGLVNTGGGGGCANNNGNSNGNGGSGVVIIRYLKA